LGHQGLEHPGVNGPIHDRIESSSVDRKELDAVEALGNPQFDLTVFRLAVVGQGLELGWGQILGRAPSLGRAATSGQRQEGKADEQDLETDKGSTPPTDGLVARHGPIHLYKVS